MKNLFSQIWLASLLFVAIVFFVSCDQTGVSGLQDADGDLADFIDGDADQVKFVDGDQDDIADGDDVDEDDYADGDQDSFVDGDDSCVCDCDCVNRAVVPRLILRDADGVAVPIMTVPGWRAGDSYTDLPKLGESRIGRCFYGGLPTSYIWGQTYHNYYSLENGRIEDCLILFSDWHKAAESSNGGSMYLKFRDENCTTPYYLGSPNVYAVPYINIDGRVYSAGGAADSDIGEGYYVYSNGTCEYREANIVEKGNYKFFRYQLVSSEVLNRFPDAPYTIAMEY